MIGAAFGIGFIIGPAVGGLLSRWGYAVPSFAAAGLSLVNPVWVLVAVPESLTRERRAELAIATRPSVTAQALFAALRRPLVGPLLHTRLFHALAFGPFQATFALYAAARLNLSSQSTGYVLAYVGLLAVVVQGLAIGPLVKRHAEGRLIVASVALMAVSLVAWGFVPNVGLLLVVLAPLSLAAEVLNTVLSSALTKAVPRDEVGGTLGLATALQAVAGIVAPAAGGLLLQELGAWALGLACVVRLEEAAPGRCAGRGVEETWPAAGRPTGPCLRAGRALPWWRGGSSGPRCRRSGPCRPGDG